MTDKERKLNQIHNEIIELYGDNTRVEIAVTYDGIEVTTYDRMNIREFSMRRINGEWVEKR
mgnify:CR=1 FL=1